MTNVALKLVVGGKEIRDQFINQTDVLDKVKVLITLPINEYVETKKVAEYFEVNDVNVRAILARNKEEFKSDGVVTMMGAELKYLKGQLIELHGITLNARSMVTLFTKKAVLRMGMMLESSPIAKEIRNYLLNNVEDNSIAEQKETALQHKGKVAKSNTNWNEGLDNSIIESVINKLNNGQKISYALKEVSEEMGIPHARLYSRWYTGGKNNKPLKLKLDKHKSKDVSTSQSSNDIEKFIEENNKKMIYQFEKMMTKQQEGFLNALGRVWRKLEETKEQQNIILDDIKMVKLDISEMTQSVDKNVNEDIQRLEKRSKSLLNKLKGVETENDRLLKFIGKHSVMSEALMNDEDNSGVRYKMDNKGNINIL